MLCPALVCMLVHSACEWSGNELISTCMGTGTRGWLWLRQLTRETVMSVHDFWFFFLSEGSGETPKTPHLTQPASIHTPTPTQTIHPHPAQARSASASPLLSPSSRTWCEPRRREQIYENVELLPVRRPGALCPFSKLIKQNTSFSRFVSLAFILCGSARLVQTASPRRTAPYRRRASESWEHWDDKSSFSAGFAGGIFLTDDGWFLHAALRERNGATLCFIPWGKVSHLSAHHLFIL